MEAIEAEDRRVKKVREAPRTAPMAGRGQVQRPDPLRARRRRRGRRTRWS